MGSQPEVYTINDGAITLEEFEISSFYNLASYVILQRSTGEDGGCVTNIHCLVGENNAKCHMDMSIDKAIELGEVHKDHNVVHHTEWRGRESELFISYFQPWMVPLGKLDRITFTRPDKDPTFQTRLFSCRGTNALKLMEVPYVASSLTHDGVFILETEFKIFQFNGSRSKYQLRAAAIEVVQIMKDKLCQGICEVSVIDDISTESLNDEYMEFWLYFGGVADIKDTAPKELSGIEAESSNIVEIYQKKVALLIEGNTDVVKAAIQRKKVVYIGGPRENLQTCFNRQREGIAIVQFSKKVDAAPLFEGEKFCWSVLDALTEIRQQGLCGCCYAIAAADCIAAMYYINFKKKLQLSFQEIIDCCIWTFGCKHGSTLLAYMYAQHKPGLSRLEDYPFIGQDGTPRSVRSAVMIDAVGYIPDEDFREERLMKYIKVQPLTIDIYWGPNLASFNGKGLYEGESSTTWFLHRHGWPQHIFAMGKHAVLLTGFGTSKKHGKYWIFQNSHGVEAGKGGLYKVRRGGEVDVIFGKLKNGLRTCEGGILVRKTSILVPLCAI